MWLVRIARGGNVLAPGDGTDPVQFTDVKDVGDFALSLAERERPGAYNVAGPTAGRMTFREFLEALNAATGTKANLVWVSEEFLQRHGVRPFSNLAMWIPVRAARKPGFMQINMTKALAAGLRFRPLQATAEDEFRSFKETMPRDYEFGTGKSNKGFSRARELELLAAWRASVVRGMN